MNVKNNVKKVMAVTAGAALMLSTLGGALAYDLSDYPAPFVENGVANVGIVIGANAATADVIGALDIAASLQAEARSAVSVDGGVAVAEGAEVFDEIVIGSTTTEFAPDGLNYRDLDGFVDDDFDFRGSTINYRDFLRIPTGAISIQGAFWNATEENYGNQLFAEVAEEGIKYVVEISNSLDTSLVTETDYAEFDFLGQTMKVTTFGADNQSMTVELSSEHFLAEGDSVMVDGREVTLVAVGDGSVIVSVDGQTRAISGTNTQRFSQAGNFEVRVESVFYRASGEGNSANLVLGDTIRQTVTDGDSAELFGEPSRLNEATWVWHIDMNPATGDHEIGLRLNKEYADLDARDIRDRNALALGESISLPNNYATVEFAALSQNSFTEVIVEVDNRYNLRARDNGPSTDGNKPGFRLMTADNAPVFRVGNRDTSEVWFIYNDSSSDTFQVWYEDGSDEVYAGDNLSVSMRIGRDSWDIEAPNVDDGVAGYLEFTTPENTGNAEYVEEVIALHYARGNRFFGALSSGSNATDVRYYLDASASGEDIGNVEHDGGYVMTRYGAFFANPVDQLDRTNANTFSMMVPRGLQEASIVVRSQGSVVTAGSSGSAYMVNPIALGLGVLDTDAPALGSKPMIIVGGPAANTVAAEFLGNPTQEQILETFSQGKALIRYDNSRRAMLVAGWEATETQGASHVVANFGNYNFQGNELEVTVTDLSDIRVNTVN